MVDVRLITLVTLCEEKSYVNTAKKLFITQPCVTHHIKSLEHDHSIKIFEGRGFILTEKGELLYKYAKAAIENFNNLKNSLAESETTKLSMGITLTALECLGRKKVTDIAKANGLSLDINVLDKNSVMRKLTSGEYEFALIDSSYDSTILSSVDIYTTRIVVVVSKNGKYVNIDNITRDDLNNASIIMGSTNEGLYEATISYLKGRNITISPNRICHTNDFGIMKELIVDNDAIGFVYYDTALRALKDDSLKEVGLESFTPSHNIYMVYRKASTQSSNLARLIDSMKRG